MATYKEYYEFYKVHVIHGSFSDTSHCCKENCQNHDKYLVFIGGSQLSNLEANCCSEHLAEYMDTAIEYSQKKIRERVELDQATKKYNL
jgi:hypothetical protein